MRRRGAICAGLVILTIGLYHLHTFLARDAAVSMLKLSDDLQFGQGMHPHSLLDVARLNDTPSAKNLKRIAVVMAIHQDTVLYRAAVENHRQYCELHGYHFLTQSKDLLPEAPFPQARGKEYQKAAVLMQALLIGLDGREFDWILWTDLDTLIINPSIPLESLLPPPSTLNNEHPPYFLGNQDHNGFNAGVFFLKVVPWSVQLMALTMAEPYQIYQSGALSKGSRVKAPTLNDQATLSRIFQSYPSFAQHFHEIPYEWMNVYPPRELDNSLDTSVPHLVPENVAQWVREVEECVDHRARGRGAPRTPCAPARLSASTVRDLKSRVTPLSPVFPEGYDRVLQIHLVNYRKYEFNQASLLVLNSKVMQLGLMALVLHVHDALGADKDGDLVAIWLEQKEKSHSGMEFVKDTGLDKRRDEWYQGKTGGNKGMKWLDG